MCSCSGNAWSKTGVHFFIFFLLFFFASSALADAAAEEAALEAVDTLAPCYIFVCVVYTCVADFPNVYIKKDRTAQDSVQITLKMHR